MRCSECSQRNSVAASKCAACGSSLRRKSISLSSKVFLGISLAGALVVSLAAISNALIDPEKALTNTATTLTSKSTSVKDMMGNIKNFDHAMRKFLEKYGSLENNILTSKLSFCLPKTLYEARVFDLLPNLKLVEIDTALNASNYLILLSNGKSEVLPIIGLDVYDSYSFLPQSNQAENNKKSPNEGQLLVLLGHSTDIHGHHPRVKVLLLSSTLQSDNIVDLSDKVVPKLFGEGSAKFSPNQKDIELSISLYSRGEELNLFTSNQLKSSLPVENESLYEQLLWQNNAYSLKSQSGNSKLYALYALASTLKNHNKLPLFRNLSINAKRTIEQAPIVTSESGFAIMPLRSNKRFNTNNLYELRNDSTKVITDLKPIASGKRGNSLSWFVNSLTISHFKPTTTENRITQTAAPIASLPKETKELSQPQKVTTIPEPAKTTPAPEPNKVTSTPASTPGTQISAVSSWRTTIKLRSGPSTSQPSIYDIKPNSPITIIDKDNGWYKIKVDNKEGFVFAGLVNAGKSGGYISKIAKQNGSIRDAERHIIGSTRAGEHLVLMSGLKNNRYKVVLSDGKTGYVTKEVIDGGAVNAQPPSVP